MREHLVFFLFSLYTIKKKRKDGDRNKMTQKDLQKISTAIWRSGFIGDKNKIRQEAKEDMRRLIVSNVIAELAVAKINAEEFRTACGIL